MNHSIKNLHPEEQLAAGPVNGKSLPLQSQAVEVTLFAADDDKDTWVERQRTDKFKNVFIERLEKHWRDYLITLPEASKDSKYDKNVRIAILDTGIFIDENDSLLSAGKERIVERRNFLHPGEPGCVDTHGHGTHVARILLRFAPRAELLVAKISEGRSLKAIEPLLEALQWAGDNADIVNLSFGSPWEMPTIKPKLRGLIQKHKLVFAAASNSGGNGPRAYPARERNVFAIHATNDRGDKASGMNPAPISTMDNFSTLGVNIDSFWKGKEVSISGTSFATPIAAAMAANAVEFVRRTLTEDDHPDYFMAYGGMRVLFHCMSQEIDGYSYVKPWQDGLWDNRSNVREKLREIAVDQDWPRGR
jgi:subtilisin family serine protease